MTSEHTIDATNENNLSKPSGFPLLELMGKKSRDILEAAGMNKGLPILFAQGDTKPQNVDIVLK